MVRKRISVGPLRKTLDVGPEIRVPRPLVNTENYIVIYLDDPVEFREGTLIAMEEQYLKEDITLWHPSPGVFVIDTGESVLTMQDFNQFIERTNQMLQSGFVSETSMVDEWEITTGYHINDAVDMEGVGIIGALRGAKNRVQNRWQNRDKIIGGVEEEAEPTTAEFAADNEQVNFEALDNPQIPQEE